MSAAEPPQGANSAPPGGSAAAKPQAWGDDPGAGPVHCYIYYRVEAAHAAAARRTLATVLARLEERIGVTGRLLRRQDEPLLWMEVYEDVRDAARFEVMLADLLDTHRFSQFLAQGSMRRIERFVADADSA